MTRNLPAVPEVFGVEIAADAPPLGFDPFAPDFDYTVIYPQKYINQDWMDEWLQMTGGNPVATVSRILVKRVPNPEKGETELSNIPPDLVIEFSEANIPALVMNKTRCSLATKLTGSRNPAAWAKALQGVKLELYLGVNRDFSQGQQVLFRPIPGQNGKASRKQSPEEFVKQANEDLFAN